MKKKGVASVVMALLMVVGSGAMAESYGQMGGHEDGVVAQRGDYRDGRREGSYRESRDDRYYDRRDGRERHEDWRKHRYERRNDRIYYPRYRRHAYKGKKFKRGAGPWHDLYKGHQLPRYYRSRHYRIHHWRGHGLYAPPRGHYWAQVGADYVLVAIATAVILDMVLHH